MTKPRYPRIKVEYTPNAFALVSRTAVALRDAKVAAEALERFEQEARVDGDVLAVVGKWVTVTHA